MDKEKEGRAQEDPREQSVKETSTFFGTKKKQLA